MKKGLKKHKLLVDKKSDYVLIGIASTEIDYQLVGKLNKILDFSFTKESNINIIHAKLNVTQEFSLFTFEDSGMLFNFISNKCANGYLIKEIKNFDYFIQIFGDNNKEYFKKIIKDIKSIDNVIAVIKLDPECLVEKERLNF